MIAPSPATRDSRRAGSRLAVIDVGNTRVTIGVWEDGNVSHVARIATSDAPACDAAFRSLCSTFAGGRPPAVAVGSVVPDVLDRVVARVKEATDLDARVIGHDLPLPIPVQLRSPETVGVDRVCSAAAAFDHTRQACTVVDFGTAITVDLVGDNGVFLGGAILPGAGLQVRALHDHTAALPRVNLSFPAEPIGVDTDGAIRSGVCNGIVGAVRGLVESYATTVGKWPQVVATGGDLELFAGRCDFLDSQVPDLCLMGIGLTWAKYGTNRESSDRPIDH